MAAFNLEAWLIEQCKDREPNSAMVAMGMYKLFTDKATRPVDAMVQVTVFLDDMIRAAANVAIDVAKESTISQLSIHSTNNSKAN